VTFGAHEDLQLLGLLLSFGTLLVLSTSTSVPVPILLVLGGLGLGFAPGVPQLALPPDIVLVAILPPLLYWTAFATSLRDLRANIRPISLLAVGLVLVTTVGVAVAAHEWIDGLSWAGAFTLGAIVSPTDPLAATDVARRLGVPRRVVAVIEGESLVNDGTALVLYKVAVTAAVTGAFSLFDAGWRLVWNVAGGVAVGLAVAYAVRLVRRRVDDPPVEVTIAVLSGYFAYLTASAIGVSGVLATVTIGVYMGWYTPELTSSRSRLAGNGFWELLIYLVNALLFVLLGLQLRNIVDALEGTPWRTLLADAALVSGAVIAIRLVWVPIFTYLPRALFRRIRERDPYPPWRAPALIAWTGIRGAVSLAAALALPLDFPSRELIVFLTFAVILVTLVGQGLTLGPLIRLLQMQPDDLAEREDAKARIKAAEAALRRLEEVAGEEWVREDTAERLRGAYGFRRDRFRARLDDGDDGAIEARSAQFQRLRRELLDAERGAVVALRNAGMINDDVMARVVRDLDLEDSRLDM
jgi:CPA1 family monovalent cation:H+ antiporter